MGRIEKMTFKVEESTVRTIRRGEKGWMLNDGVVVTPRAGFEISRSCPESYKQIIGQCIDNGWLKPVAYVKDTELFWEAFKE